MFVFSIMRVSMLTESKHLLIIIEQHLLDFKILQTYYAINWIASNSRGMLLKFALTKLSALIKPISLLINGETK